MQGEYANVTYFLTSPNASEIFLWESRNSEEFDHAILFTDGIQRLVLNVENKTAHTPFFQKIVGNFNDEIIGYSEKFSANIQLLLESEAVNSRTDDDKTLIVAVKNLG
jgi:hypothetical protein